MTELINAPLKINIYHVFFKVLLSLTGLGFYFSFSLWWLGLINMSVYASRNARGLYKPSYA